MTALDSDEAVFLRAAVDLGLHELCALRPPAGLKLRVLQAIRPPGAEVLLRAWQGDWVETGFPGVRVRHMYMDPATGNTTLLAKLDPGAVYPGHRHAALEHCYVLEGDVVFADHTLHAGDYEVAGGATEHSFVTTVHGCLVFIMNNTGDRLVQ